MLQRRDAPQLHVLDVYAGCGVRGMRYLLQARPPRLSLMCPSGRSYDQKRVRKAHRERRCRRGRTTCIATTCRVSHVCARPCCTTCTTAPSWARAATGVSPICACPPTVHTLRLDEAHGLLFSSGFRAGRQRDLRASSWEWQRRTHAAGSTCAAETAIRRCGCGRVRRQAGAQQLPHPFRREGSPRVVRIRFLRSSRVDARW